MEHSYRVLGIAPYEGMKTLMADLAEEYPQMDLTLFVGDLEQGLEIAHSNFHGNYDVVISGAEPPKCSRKTCRFRWWRFRYPCMTSCVR